MNKQIYRYILVLFALAGCIVTGIVIAIQNANGKMNEPDSQIKEYNAIFATPTGDSIAENMKQQQPVPMQQRTKDVLGASTSASPSPSVSPSPSPSPSKSPTPTPTSSPSPTASPTPSPSPESACFNVSSDTKNGDTYYYGKPLELDANCSQNGSEYTWYFDGNKISQTGQKITYQVPDQNGKGEEEKEIKLDMKGKSGSTHGHTKKIKIKSVPYPEVNINSNKETFSLNESVTFTADVREVSENPVQQYQWTFKGQQAFSSNESKKDISHSFATYANTSNKTFEVELCVSTKLGVKACEKRTYNSN